MRFVINGGATTTTGNAFIFETQTGNTTPAAVLTIAKTGAATLNGTLQVTTTSNNGLRITTNDVATLKMTNSAGSTKNWGFATTYLVASDFGIYQSTSIGGDPISAGTAKLYFNGTGDATFSSNVTANGVYYVPNTSYFISGTAGFRFNNSTDAYNNLIVHDNGNTSTRGVATASSFVKSGGTGSQYLMADGSVTTGTGGSFLPLSGGTLTGNLIMQSSGNPSQLLAKGTNTEFWVDSQYGGGTARAFINRNGTGNQATLMFTTGVAVTNGTAWTGSGVDWSMGLTNDSTNNFYIGYGDIFSSGNRAITITSAKNIGIGTNTPTAISGYGALTLSGTDGSFVDFRTNNNSSGRVFASSTTALGIESLSTTLPIVFKTQNGSGSTERMKITPAGVVEISHPTSDAQLSLSAGGSTAYVKFTNSAASVWGLGNSFAGATTNFELYNFTTATYALKITNNGNVGIGINPTEKFHIYASGAGPEFRMEGSSFSWYIRPYNDNFNVLTPSGRQAVSYLNNGDVRNYNNTTTWQQSSDVRVKENINTISDAISKILSLNPVIFDYKQEFADINKWDDNKKINNVGFIAQEFETIFPKYITTNECVMEEIVIDDFKSIDTGHLVAYLVKGMQEQNEIITSLQGQINELKNK
jgi:hypothetical protein